MRVSPLRTISGRILLGFFVLALTLGGVSLWTVLQLRQVGKDLRFHRQAYLDVTLDVAQLSSRQDTIIDSLDYNREAIVRGEAKESKRIIEGLGATQKTRRDLLRGMQERLAALEKAIPERQRSVRAIATRLLSYQKRFAESEGMREALLDPAATPDTRQRALDALVNKERQIEQQLKRWTRDLKNRNTQMGNAVEETEQRARVYALVLGALALFVAFLTTLGAVITLRPLARLRDGVRKVAAGDYRERLVVPGQTEVAEIAKEFNAMAAALAQREAELIRSERLAAVGKMAAVITHEVRNPLSSIGLNTELLEEEVRRMAGEGSEAVALCRSIQKEVDRLTAITEEYLRFARLPRPKLEREQVNPIVSGIAEFQREDLAMRGVRLEVKLAEGLPSVAADEAQLRQALLNLIKNAADAMEGGGDLLLETRAADGTVEVRVRDSGPGIPEKLLARIFEPFFSTKEGGTGLGLALTQQIVLEHGGRIEVEAAPGGGTLFVVALPRAAPERRAAAGGPESKG